MSGGVKNHLQECDAEGIPYRAWCCEACAQRAGVAFEHAARSIVGGWCQVGKHNVKTETAWLRVPTSAVVPWPPKSPGAETLTEDQMVDMLDMDDAAISMLCDMSRDEIEEMLS